MCAGMAGGKIFCHTIIQNELDCFNFYLHKSSDGGHDFSHV